MRIDARSHLETNSHFPTEIAHLKAVRRVSALPKVARNSDAMSGYSALLNGGSSLHSVQTRGTSRIENPFETEIPHFLNLRYEELSTLGAETSMSWYRDVKIKANQKGRFGPQTGRSLAQKKVGLVQVPEG